MILVTGHLGFVGRHLTAELDRRGLDWKGLDLREGRDVVRPTPWRRFPVERVFHLAAQTDAQCTDAICDAMSNIIGTLRMLDQFGDKVVFASSSMVNYPTSPYAISKLAGEHYARYYGAAIVRFCNLYGPGGHSVMDKFRDAERLTIYGSGEQLRNYTVVSDAVQALLTVRPGNMIILPGTEYTVNEIAKLFPGKPIDQLPARKNDLIDAPQL